MGASSWGWHRREASARASLVRVKAEMASGVQAKGRSFLGGGDSRLWRGCSMDAQPGTKRW